MKTSTFKYRHPVYTCACVLSLMIAGASIGSAGTRGTSASSHDLQAGKKVYETTCFVCHGKDGKGAIPGVPDMTSKKSRLKQDDALLLKHATEGYQSKGSMMAMPPKGGNPKLTEPDLKNVIAYMKAHFLEKKKQK